jgi:hypothetical protein
MPHGAHIQIRGCNIGSNEAWLESFRDFFSHGTRTRRSRPHVSAPKLPHRFTRYGRRFRRRGRTRTRWYPWREWLWDRRRRRRIYPGDPRFKANIVHVR